jgi:hypothetical protein
VKDLWDRLSLTQLGALALVIGGTIGFFVFIPPRTLEIIGAWNWLAIMSGTLALVGAIRGTVGGPLVKPREMPSIPPMSIPPPSVMPPPPEIPGSPTHPGKPSLMPRERGEEE